MPKFNVQMEELAIYGLTIEITDDDIKDAYGNLEQAIRNVSEREFTNKVDITECLESVQNRQLTWFEEVK